MLGKLIARRALSMAIAAASVVAVAGGSYIATGELADDGIEQSVQGEDQAAPAGEDVDESADADGAEQPVDDAAGSAEEPETESVERFHGDETEPCTLPDGSTLSGDWTHGTYVSAWARSGEPGAAAKAAQSRCGKPAHAGGRDKEADGTAKAKKNRADGDTEATTDGRDTEEEAGKTRRTEKKITKDRRHTEKKAVKDRRHTEKKAAKNRGR